MIESGSDKNCRSAVITEANLIIPGGLEPPTPSDAVLRTPHVGNVRALAPPLPQPLNPTPPPYNGYGVNAPYNMGYGSGYNSFPGGIGNDYGNFIGYNRYQGGYGLPYANFGGYGSGYGGMNPTDPEARFIRMVEASSRPAFQSIESLVSAIGNIASMLDSTFFALTSSFRAVLGVAANFGRLRGMFSQFWHSFAVYRFFVYIYKKILYWLQISKNDASVEALNKAYDTAINQTTSGGMQPDQRFTQKIISPWPVLAFLSFIVTAPYLIKKLLGTMIDSAQEETRNPRKWVNSIKTVTLYDFQARSHSELSFRANTILTVAPKEVQNSQGLLGTGWGLATIDGRNTGLVPLNYVKSPKQIHEEQREHHEDSTTGASQHVSTDPSQLSSQALQSNRDAPSRKKLSSSSGNQERTQQKHNSTEESMNVSELSPHAFASEKGCLTREELDE